ncbi:MAG: ribonuclease E/G [Clostridiales bacterium]|nr:ribonuclease E/G [Clostridiales bacterium]MDD6293580.1 ribonuclease E/G [Eubacteriales bacterium]
MSKFIIADIDLTYIRKNAAKKAYNYTVNKQNDESDNENVNKSNDNADNKTYNKIFCGLYEKNRFYEVNFSDYIGNDESAKADSIGNIYVGKVKDVVKNINAAFVEYKKGCIGYLSLEENKHIIFLNKKNTDKVCEGDDIIVQISKAAVKTKFPVLTSNISLTGRNVVVNIGKSGIGFSGKIKNTVFKSHIHDELDDILDNSNEKFGIVIRTNAENAKDDDIKNELNELLSEWENIKEIAMMRKCYTLLKSEEAPYIKMIKNLYVNETDEIITDNEEIYQKLMDNFNGKYNIRLYDDTLLPLYKLYSIEKVIEEICSKKVWLKSGAYLVIEPTEAMTVIDVNTGKCTKGKKLSETIVNVNVEAAKEIAYQMRLRNMSGIVMVDFINMENKEFQDKLLEYLTKLVHKDRIKTNVVDITKLNIVEITRKKVERPVYEQIYQ